jgi:fatty-acyl-CoA synthase
MGARSVSAWIENVAERDGGRCAIVEGETRLTFSDLARESRRVAAGLRDLGLRRGDSLALWLPNYHEWLVLDLACARLGLPVVALNTRYRAAELAPLLAVSSAKALALTPSFRGGDFVAMARDAAHRVQLIGVRGTPDGAVPYAQLREHGEAAPEGTASDLLNVFPTSGTTASPKLAAHTQAAVVQHAENVVRAIHLGTGDVMLMALPLCGVFGFAGAMAALGAGATLLLEVAFDAAEAARRLADQRVTHFYGPDGMLRAVIESPAFETEAVRAWRWGGFANFTTGKPVELIRLAEARAGIRLVGLYGSSECFALMSSWRQDDEIETRAQAGGFPVSLEIEVRAGDPDSGAPLPAGDRGELQVRGYNVMHEYLGNPDATRAAFTSDGWFRSGDLGHVNSDGSFVFLTRLKDSLRVRGYLLDPAEVEEYLLRHPSVAQAQVVGIPSPMRGDVPVAFVQLVAGATAAEEDLLAYCRQGIADYKVPRRICLVGEFPVVVGPNGVKIQRHRLREMAAGLLGDDRP